MEIGIHNPERPVVSIGMMAYNHEKYIARAIESVLMQEVNFPFELVIAEDCSTDNTRQIVIDYQKRYPGVIRLILHETNVGMQENSNCLRRACKGKYRANLEGDDFWIDPNKLQSQVNFLETHPDFIATGGDFLCIDDDENPCAFPWGKLENTYCQDEEYTKEHLSQWLLPAHISSAMFRNVFADIEAGRLQRFEETQVLGDRRVYLFLVMQGRIRHEQRNVMVRRILKKSGSSFTSAVKGSNWQEINYDWLCEAERYAKSEFNYKLDLSARKEMHWLGSLKMFFWNPTNQNLEITRSIFKKSDHKIRYIWIGIRTFLAKTGHVLKRDGLIRGIKNGLKKVTKHRKRYEVEKEQIQAIDMQTNRILKSFSGQ